MLKIYFSFLLALPLTLPVESKAAIPVNRHLPGAGISVSTISSQDLMSDLLSLSAFPFGDVLGLSPYWNWKTIESEHFRVSYPDYLSEVAQRATNYLEEAHSILSPLIRWKPHYKAQILLIDNADLANGLTMPSLRVGITLWITPPDNWLVGTEYYDNYLRLLCMHEYTHFLNMDTTEDFYGPLRYLFGDTLLPNAAWYPWMLEGLAVYMETRFTTAGRGRGPYYDMTLRAGVEEKVLDHLKFMTLNKLNGYNPYFPGGDTRYIFGYNLMNELAHQSMPGKTADGKDNTSGGDDLLGILSKRSGARIPFFINGNVENITGKDWYTLWDGWVKKTTVRIHKDLDKIKSQPVSSLTRLTGKQHELSNEVFGSAVSPDGKWLAYTMVSANRRYGLYLRNLKTDEILHIDDKLYGIGMAFTPDSKAIIYSEIDAKPLYYEFSDLKVYSLEDHSIHYLTYNLRARDPDVSRDGKWVTFTLTETAVTGLALAPLLYEDGKYQLGAVQKIYIPQIYDHIGNPKFSPDGTQIYFSFHPNGKSQEDLMAYHIQTGKISTLVSNGKYNRFPAVTQEGDLYFVSNATGVDNLYLYHPDGKAPSLVTNLITGLRFPAFGPEPHPTYFYASVFSTSGWDLTKIELSKSPISQSAVTVGPPPAPPIGPHSISHREMKKYPESDYSVFPSILPRAWIPLLGGAAGGVNLGAALLGFDTTERQGYVGSFIYGSQLQLIDWSALYGNRTLGPTLALSASNTTTNVQLGSNSAVYSRNLGLSATAELPISWTWSSLTPAVGFNLNKVTNYQTGSNLSQAIPTSIDPIVPSIDESLTYSNAVSSNLAIVAEGGRTISAGACTYFLNSNEQIWKGILLDQEYIRIIQHTVLVPTLKGVWVSHINQNYATASSILEGRTPQQIISPFPADGFNQFAIRGYPGYSFFSKAATVGSLDLNFPLGRLFQGLGTNPLFFDNFYGDIFYEASYFPYSGAILPSTGAGLLLQTEIFMIPLTFSLNFQKGLRSDLGGSNDFFFSMSTVGL